MKYYLKILRVPNLIIIALAQFLLYYQLIIKPFALADVVPLLNTTQITLIILITMMVAGSGYIINDITDLEIDKKNRPYRVVIGKYISIQNGWRYYWFLVISGALMSLGLAFYENELHRFWMYPLAILCMYYYSKKWKCRPLLGNFVVSIFCGFVTGIILYIEKDGWAILPAIQKDYILFSFLGYSAFAFLSNFYREVIKDIEDMTGDRINGCETFPVKFGQAPAKKISIFFLFSLLISLLVWLLGPLPPESNYGIAFILLLLFPPVLIALFLTFKAKKKEDFALLSKIAKVIMLNGILYLFII